MQHGVRIESNTLAAVLVGALLGAGSYAVVNHLHTIQVGTRPSIRAGQQGLINPLLATGDTSKTRYADMTALAKELTRLTTDQKQSGAATDISVYFRELDSGHWTGVNEDAKYFPASLFKVPVMIAYEQWSESDPSILNQKLHY